MVGTSHVASVGAMVPLIPLYAVAQGASLTMVGVVVSSGAVLPLIFSVWAGAGVDVLGPRRMAFAGALIFGVSATLIAAVRTLPALIAGMAIAGLAHGIVILAVQTSVAHVSLPHNRDRNFGLLSFWIGLGQLLGPLAGGLVAEAYSIRVALYACGAVAIFPSALALRLATRARHRVGDDAVGLDLHAHHAYRSAWAMAQRADVRFLMWVAFLVLFAWSIKSSFYPLYLQSVGLPKSAIGLIFSFMGVGATIVRPLIGLLSGRFGRRSVLLGAVTIGGAVMGTIPFLTGFWPLALTGAGAGMAWGITQPLTMSLMVGSVATHERGLALSLRLTSNRLAEVLSPMLFGAIIVWTGLRGAFFLSAAALMVGVLAIGRSGNTVE